jgi:adenine-specific DNA-methyltransferase
MDKLKMHSPNLTDENVAKIRDLFPGCVTEAVDENGKPRLVVDFDQLRQELSDQILEGAQERYRLEWPGKRMALIAANSSVAKTLRPDRKLSINFEETKNLFIEGDNLDAMKVIQEVYLGKINMIYIDPPYNTGRDFLYDDDFSQSAAEFLEKSFQVSALGERLLANLETKGRFHSDWLSMMYSRLLLAKRLLSKNGTIFISIDDNEQHNLRKICDEIFGEDNFIGCLPTVMNMKGNNDQFGFAGTHEYTIVYARDRSSIEKLNGIPLEAGDIDQYDQVDAKGRYKQGATLMRTGEDGARTQRPKGYYPIYVSSDYKKMSTTKMSVDDFEVFPKASDGTEMSWRRSSQTLSETLDEFIIKKTSNGISFYKKQRLVDDLKNGKKPKSLFYKPEYSSGNGTSAVSDLLGGRYFDNPKPVDLLKDLISVGLGSNGIILDFFAGSGTTAEATLRLNSEDGGTRKFIMIQLPEATNDKSVARKGGYQTISEVSQERIRRVGKKILEGGYHHDWNCDVGFRVLKIDTSNMQDVYYRPDQIKQEDLLAAVDNIKLDRSPEDLLFQVLVDWGVDLTLPIERETVQGKTVFFVDENALVACFESGVTEELVKELAGHQPLRVVFRDNGFVSDAVKINVEQIFRQLSPNTDIKSI